MSNMRKLWNNLKGSAVGFIIGLLIIGFVVSALVGAFTYQVHLAQTNACVAGNATWAGIPGGVAMLGIMSLLFIVIPVIIFARAAK